MNHTNMKRTLQIASLFTVLLVMLPASLANITNTRIFTNENPDHEYTSYSVAFGDVDNDGDLDMAVASGGLSQTPVIYENEGTGITTNILFDSASFGAYYVGTNNAKAVAFADVDNDGDLDFAVGGLNHGISQTASGNNLIFENKGHGIFYRIMWEDEHRDDTRSIAFADVDNDGDLDFAVGNHGLTFGPGENNNEFIYENDGHGITHTTLLNRDLGGAKSIAFADVDNDGDLDFAVGQNGRTAIYENDGSGITSTKLFEQNCMENTQSIAFADVDNDGDLDFSLGTTPSGSTGTGCPRNTDGHERVYENIGGRFSNTLYDDGTTDDTESVSFADVDNDGKMDFSVGNHPWTTDYDPGVFTHQSITSTILSHQSDIATDDVVFADVDRDGDLDAAVANAIVSQILPDGTIIHYRGFTYVYENDQADGGDPNVIPLPPTTGFRSTRGTNSARLEWAEGSDAETPSQALFYNLRVGTCSGCNNIVSGMYGLNDQNDYFGNGRQANFRNLKNLAPGIYYWSVQSIDNELAPSVWGAEQRFVIGLTFPGPLPKPLPRLDAPIVRYGTQ